MATVIGIFEECYSRRKPLPVVKPGSQSRRFTHIQDTIKICYEAWKKINRGTIASQIKKVIQYYQLRNYLNQKLNSYLQEKEKGLHLL